jgi:hypothetical protein
VVEDVGTPHVQIIREAQSCDAVILGRETNFEFETTDRSDHTLSRVLTEPASRRLGRRCGGRAPRRSAPPCAPAARDGRPRAPSSTRSLRHVGDRAALERCPVPCSSGPDQETV